MTAETRTYLRFARAQRIEHVLLITAFTTLALTGLPQKFAAQGWADTMIHLLGGIESTRIIHRIAASVMMAEAIYHLVSVGYRVLVARVRMTMLPGLQDARDFWYLIGYIVGLRKERPAQGRYTVEEKVEYWALIWGTVIMIISGFMLWNPIATTRLLPGEFIPAAKSAHGGEALLAVLAVIVWHFYHVHIRSFNKSMFSGVMSEAEMRHEHPRELALIEAGRARRTVDPVTLKRRQRVFYPAAGFVSLLLIVGLYRFTSFEQTAITTLPPEATMVAFAPQTSTPLPATPTALPTATPRPPTATPAGGVTPTPTPAGQTSVPVAAVDSWNSFVGPLFAQKCTACHGVIGNLSLASYASARQGGKSGPAFVAGDAANSKLIEELTSTTHPIKLSAEDLDRVKAWIDAGAPEN